MVTKVWGRVDGKDVIFSYAQGDVWQVPVPLDLDGEYVVEILAEDEAGNQSYLARLLYTVAAGTVCVHRLPLPKYLFERRQKKILFSRKCPVCQGVVP